MIPDLLPSDAPRDGQDVASARIVSLGLRGERRRELQQLVRSGAVTQVASSDVLAAEGLPRLAMQSLWLFIVSAAAYAVVIGGARQWDHTGQLLGVGPVALRLVVLAVINVVGYVLMIPMHEATHALVILTMGGRPRFGLKLPLAAYCTAPHQLFLRDGYLAVALAPLVGLSALAIVVAVLAPNVAAALLLFVAGNVSGAVGDIEVARAIRKLPADTLIADTETGYIAYRAQR
ncbi:MAG TPA: DUF3267 domain-containing protein [Ktedonobacterales bacterium]|jgi:hypothetical protein|nr:DUF3267 domain-containing protein [Ktedonobacterales bacterium]